MQMSTSVNSGVSLNPPIRGHTRFYSYDGLMYMLEIKRCFVLSLLPDDVPY